jgi:hypothetical protein
MDFILEGIDELLDDYVHGLRPRDIDAIDMTSKNNNYGVLDRCSGFLTLPKEFLARHHQDLVYAGKLGEARGKGSNGTMPNSGSLVEALERLVREIGLLGGT